MALPPFAVLQVPCHCALEAAGKRFPRCPAKLPAYLSIVNCIAKIMAWPIRNEFDEFPMRPVRRMVQRRIKQVADFVNQIYIGTLCAPTNVVGLARYSSVENTAQGLDVVIYV